MADGTKPCSRCGQSKQLEEFNRDRRMRDGRRSDCKVCQRSRVREYWLKHRDRYVDSARASYRANREQRKAYQREYYRQHREERLAYGRARTQAADKELRRAYEREYWARRRHAARQKGHRWRALQRSATIASITDASLAGKWGYWGGLCWMCGSEAESWDHVKPLSKGGAHCLANLRPACRSCNSSKNDRWPLLSVAA